MNFIFGRTLNAELTWSVWNFRFIQIAFTSFCKSVVASKLLTKSNSNQQTSKCNPNTSEKMDLRVWNSRLIPSE
jgi:hypothetical protein